MSTFSVRLENDKIQLHGTLEAIPTLHEFRHLATCLRLEQQVIMQQLERYRTLTGRTEAHIADNEEVLLRMNQRIAQIRSETKAERKDLVNLANTVPHIQKDCTLHAAEQA